MKTGMPYWFVILLLGGCGQSGTAPLESGAPLEAMTPTWEAAFNGNDAEGLGALYAEDAVLLPPNAPAENGRKAIVEAHANDGSVSLDLIDRESWISGNVGYKRGDYVMKAGDAVIDKGRYVEIWKKINGEWKIHRDIYNSSLPPTEG